MLCTQLYDYVTLACGKQNDALSAIVSAHVDTLCADQLQQLSSQPNGQTRIDAERKLQKQKQDLDQQLSQKAQQLLQMRLVRCMTIVLFIVM